MPTLSLDAKHISHIKRAFALGIYYAALTAAVVVTLAVALMCSGSELATLIMATGVFGLGLFVGNMWMTGGRTIKEQREVCVSRFTVLKSNLVSVCSFVVLCFFCSL
jgi:NO-binding membrane sensor protein with MHYT domain